MTVNMNVNVSNHQIQQLAHRQLLDYRASNPGSCFSEPNFNIDIKTAYSLQDAVAKVRVKSGESIIGYKVGCTGPGTIAQFGMEGPIRGTLFRDEVLKNGSSLNKDAFCQLAIEGEMAIKIGSNSDIGAVFPVIELHNFVFRKEKKTLPELIGNNGINAGLVLPGAEWQQSRAFIAKSANLTVRINNNELGSGALWPIGGGPEGSVDWLRGHLEEHGASLVPGQIVLAGTNLGLYPVQSGDQVTVFLDGHPIVCCSIQ